MKVAEFPVNIRIDDSATPKKTISIRRPIDEFYGTRDSSLFDVAADRRGERCQQDAGKVTVWRSLVVFVLSFHSIRGDLLSAGGVLPV